ncbi:MAG TPA: serine/threonine-protein kinase [Phycisphaerae bacterium]
MRAQSTSTGGTRRGRTAEIALPADLVSGYVLQRELHRGGQGIVYLALQQSTGRSVALKVLRESAFSGPLERGRFEREVQVLAKLRHPNIVTIHDCGTAGANPYLVMDYIEGWPLDAYIQNFEKSKNRKIEIKELLELFTTICDAVNAAHLRGVIHRDLKPSNIRVDRAGVPHILDFGLAKLAVANEPHAADEDTPPMTVTGQFVGSLPWAAPEQVEGEPDSVDTRTDVYALGVILYQLLTGRFPYPVAGRMRLVMAHILESQPADPRSHRRQIDDELATLVLKCLTKERERRYQTAGELGRDIVRYLAGEPIEAKRDSGWYMLKKSLRRYRLPVGMAAGIVLLLAVFGLAMASARARAEREAVKSRQVLAFLQNMLAGVDPDDIGPDALTVREVLDHAAERLERELVDQPEVAASVHQTLGNHYSTLGLYFDADRHLRKAVELRRTFTTGDDPELAEALTDLAANLQEKRDIADAEAPTREALDMRRRLFGPHSLEVAESQHDLASILIETGRAGEAEPLARESLDTRRRHLGAEHGDVATSTGMLGWCLMALGKLDEAETAMRDAVEMVRRLPGDNERALAARLTFLSDILRTRGKYVEEEAVVREAIDIRSRRLAQDHPSLAWNLLCLARIRWRIGNLDEAETACRKALDIYTKKRSSEHWDIADCQELLAQIYDDRGQFVEAEPWWSACLAMRRKLLPPDHPEIKFAEDALVKNRAARSGDIRTSDPRP